jgi:hypothetical protein
MSPTFWKPDCTVALLWLVAVVINDEKALGVKLAVLCERDEGTNNQIGSGRLCAAVVGVAEHNGGDNLKQAHPASVKRHAVGAGYVI